MDKKMTSGIAIGRRGTQIISKDSNHDGGNIKICNRLGCSTRHDSSLQESHTSKSEKLKCPKAFSQQRSKYAISASSKAISSSSNCRKPKEQQDAASEDSRSSSAASESSTSQELTGTSSARAVTGKAKLTSKTTKNAIADRRRKKPESDSLIRTSDVNSGTSGSTISNTHLTSQNQTHKWIVSRNRGASSSSSAQQGVTPGCTTFQPTSYFHGQSINLQRYGLRNISSSSLDATSDFSLDSIFQRKSNTLGKRDPDRSCSSRCKGKAISSKEERSLSPRATPPGPVIRDNHIPQLATHRTRYGSINNGIDQNSSRRIRNREIQRNVMNTEDGIYFISEHPLGEEVLQTQPSGGEVEVIRRSLLSLTETSPSIPGSSSEAAQSLRTRQISRLDDRVRREPARSFQERDSYHSQTIDGIREVLLALDRIEQDADMSHEHLLLLETSLLLGSLGIPDQHRDMRLDIDNMSYEELLALGEKMGTVNTALNEETLLKCLKRSAYDPNSLVSDTSEDAKCSICQEDYAIGEEIGKLACEHFYHTACISQWFQLKNWCPICKASASS